MTAFTVEEKTIIKMYADVPLQRDELVLELEQNLSAVEEPEIADTMRGIISKIGAMSEAELQEIDLSDALDPDGEPVDMAD